jgi:hypothetical protein
MFIKEIGSALLAGMISIGGSVYNNTIDPINTWMDKEVEFNSSQSAKVNPFTLDPQEYIATKNGFIAHRYEQEEKKKRDQAIAEKYITHMNKKAKHRKSQNFKTVRISSSDSGFVSPNSLQSPETR